MFRAGKKALICFVLRRKVQSLLNDMEEEQSLNAYGVRRKKKNAPSEGPDLVTPFLC